MALANKIPTFSFQLKIERCHLLLGLILFRKIGFKKALRTVYCLSTTLLGEFKLFSFFEFNFSLKKEYSLDFFATFFIKEKSREMGVILNCIVIVNIKIWFNTLFLTTFTETDS